MALAATPSKQPYSLIVSQRGNPQILHEGFTYSKYIEFFTTGEVGWRCTVKTCKAKIYTLGQIINRTFNKHSHQPLDEESLNRRAAKNLFNQIKRTNESTLEKRFGKDFSDVNDAGDDNAFLHSMEASEIEIDVDPEFETVDIKPNILLDNLPPLPPSPVPTKRRKRNSDQLETASSAAGKRSKSDQSLQRSCDFGDDDGDDDYQPDSGDDFDSEEDSAKVRRAYDLLKSVFDKKDKYDIFCNRLAGRLRGLKSPKVCRHVQQLLVTVVADAEAGRYDNVPG